MGKSALWRTLTPRMRGVLFGTALVVVAGLIATALVLMWPASPPGAGVSPAERAAASTPGPVAGAQPTSGSEVQEPDPDALVDRLPPRESTSPRIALPLPASASAQGSLVDGYPADLAAPATASEVLHSSVSSEGETLQFALSARTDATIDEVREHYVGAWTAAGLVAPDAGTDVLAFSDAFSSVSLAIETSGTGTVYSIHGVLRAG